MSRTIVPWAFGAGLGVPRTGFIGVKMSNEMLAGTDAYVADAPTVSDKLDPGFGRSTAEVPIVNVNFEFVCVVVTPVGRPVVPLHVMVPVFATV